MYPVRPQHMAPDFSLPVSLGHSEQARQYVGRRVCRLFGGQDWYTGTVVSVDIHDNIAYMKVWYEADADEEEMWWEDFRKWAVVERAAGPHAGGPHESGAAGHQTPAHQQQQYGGRGGYGAADAGGEQRHGLEPGSGGQANGSSQPRRRKAVAPPSSKVTHPGSQHPARGQAADHAAGADGPEPDRIELLEDSDSEQGRPATRRRLNLEPYEAPPRAQPHPQPQPPPQPPPQQMPQHERVAAKAPPRRTLGGREPFAAGHLHRIQLVNFMNHENLEVLFNKHVTFVAGLNGSGKSALLQGLQACLGASARDTGRGSSLGNWVRRERRTATVTLEMWNTTEEEVEMQKWPPFRHELYGSMIRIVRKISAGEPDAAGNRTVTASSYQLFAADGSEVKPSVMRQSASKEVGVLAEHFNVDASNPLIVITQDMAARFHQATQGPRCKKYEMYMAGTCLAKTRDTLAAAHVNVARTHRNLLEHLERLRTKQSKVKELERRLKTLQDAEIFKSHLANLEVATVWAIVEEARAGLREQKAAAAAFPARVAELEEAVRAAETAAEELQSREAALRDEMEHTRSDQLPARMRELGARRQAAKRRRQELVRQLDEAAAAARDLTDRRTSLEEELEALEAERQGEGLMQRVREHQQQVDAKQGELVALQAAISALEADHNDRSARLTDAEAAAGEAATAAEAARAAAKEASDAHGELLAAAGGNEREMHLVNVRAWGHGPMALVAAVRAAPRGTFSQPPLGPVGLYLRRRADCDASLGRVLELALRGCLGLWLVDRHEDGDALRRLAERVGCRPAPQVVVSPFRERVHDFGWQPVVDGRGRVWRRLIDLVEPREELEPLLRATLINNALLDQSSAANVVLVGSQEEGQLVGRGLDRGLVDRRIRKAYDPQGACYSSLGGRAMVTETFTLPSTCRLAANNRAQLAESEREVAAREAERQQAEAAARDAQAAVAAARRELQELQRRQQGLARQKRLAQSQLESLLEAAPAAVSEAHSTDLLNQLAATQRDLTQAVASQTRLETERNNAAAEAQALTAELEELHKQTEEYKARREELMQQLSQLAQRKQEAAEALADWRARLQAEQEGWRGVQDRIDEFERRTDQAYHQAARHWTYDEGVKALQRLRDSKRQALEERFPNKTQQQRDELLAQALTPRGLQQWAAEAERRIQQAERQAEGHLDEISLQLAAARADLERARVAQDAVAKQASVMHEAAARRKAKYKWLRQQIEHVSNSKFSRYMQRRNITARLELDHVEERLDLTVRKNHEEEQATSLMQLSGGERSFTTSAFLLAMGEVLDTPFRAMDEYDVYMDNSARKLATMALLEFAWRSNPGSQLVLLSPQDTATLTEAFESLVRTCEKERLPVPPKDYVKIVRLPDPR
ncbi:hypothetical protein PLESTB_001481400 [Pleodorina starrii]|uniref:Rad50/SbcC-type AAA domain-containing protein n=1 Tax=Pleodorina starrii TaxID=330485 RepID=A0A9W6BWB2_9CHLO|nr:hypothetical protein PLESTM_000652900 [Pleodorina starrii]GLC59393.1 hypothetical protein PLESTB_001481400 [Pleodorina starrii]GLC74408.1 hypothetical protein PLESTF_001509900 [Pleodorina starrii]